LISTVKGAAKRIPGVRWARSQIGNYLRRRSFKGSSAYWEGRYRAGGTSGVGSYGHLAEFKASVLNQFVVDRAITSVIEFGCGDGNQLRYAAYPRYIGLDVAHEAIRLCRAKFEDDSTKSFFVYDPECFVDHGGVFQADLALSLDVLFHLSEDSVFARYIELLFQAARRFVIIYSSNHDEITSSPHERHREFTRHVAAHVSGWRLAEKIENRYPLSRYPAPVGSLAEFFVYERRDGVGLPCISKA